MRLFIAIDMPPALVQAAEKIQYQLQNFDFMRAHYTHADGMHLTLKFLGEVPDNEVERIAQIVSRMQFAPAQAHTGSVATFSSDHFIRIIFWHIICPELSGWVCALHEQLPEYPADEREFIGHLTLARIKSIKNREQFVQAINAIEVPRIDFTIAGCVLKKSLLTPSGAVYSTL